MQAIRITRIIVRRDRVVCYVELDPDAPRTTSPEIARRLIERAPTLPQHDCINDRGPTFGDVIECTSLPHVLEHLAIDFQTREAAESPDARMRARLFRGTTEWVNVQEGRAKIELEYADDLMVLRSLAKSLDLLNTIVLP